MRYEYLLKQSHYISSLNKFLFQSTLARPLLSAVLLFLGFDHYLRKQLKFWILHFDKNKLSIEEIEILVNSEKKYSIISLNFLQAVVVFLAAVFLAAVVGVGVGVAVVVAVFNWKIRQRFICKFSHCTRCGKSDRHLVNFL